MPRPKVVSLFSGGGGLDLGFLQAGYDIVWANDINKDAVEVYRSNIEHNIVAGDINAIDNRLIPACDVIVGGPPCQSFSLAGNRHCNDERGRLVWRYLDILDSHRPKAFLFENVTGLLSAKNAEGNKILPLLLDEFGKLGYNVTWKVVNAADYGVPQLRKRVIVVGLRGQENFEFPEPTHNADGTGGKHKYVSVEEAIGDLPEFSDDPKADHTWPQMSELDKFIVSHVTPGGNYMDIPDSVDSLRIHRLKRDGGHTTCYGRLHPLRPAYTINTYFNRPNVGCNIHYRYNRLITIREALRLQSFPDNYILTCKSKSGKHLIVGNAVPPRLAEALARQLLKFI